jgi:hypothetical protein
MRDLGAKVTDAEAAKIVDEIQSRSPKTVYPLGWERASTFRDGAWNVVALSAWKGSLFLGLEGNGRIYRSEDGSHWDVAAETGSNRAYGLVPFRGALYAGTSDPVPEIWASEDGKTWKKTADLPAEQRGVISLGVFGQDLYAGTEAGRVFRSSDGKSWEEAAAFRESMDPNWVRFLIPFKGYLYAGSEHAGVFRSQDGLRWEPVAEVLKEGLEDSSIRPAAVFRDALYVGSMTRGEIWKTDDGTAWSLAWKTASEQTGGYIGSMSVFMDDLYAGVNGLIIRTRDGEKWEEAGYLGPYTVEAMTPFQGQFYAGTLLIGLSRLYRTSLGRPGAKKEEGLLVRQMLRSPRDPKVLYAATFNQGIFKSRDRGESWVPINRGIKTYLVSQMAIHPVSQEILYAATWGGGIYKSRDGGALWRERNKGLENSAVWGMIIDPRSSENLYAGTSTGIYRSLDGGNNWVPFNEGLEWNGPIAEGGSFAFLPSDPHPVLFVGTNLGGFRWDPSARRWQEVEGLRGKRVTSLVYDPVHQIFFAGTSGEGLLESRDEGKTWTNVRGLESLSIDGIIPDTRIPVAIFLATHQGIRWSADGGETWTAMGEGMNPWVASLTVLPAMSPHEAPVLYAGTHDQGIWRSPFGPVGKESWALVRGISILSPKERDAALLPRSATVSRPKPPDSFSRCNECHGWTDPQLNQRPSTPWRVSPTRRDWGNTVARMSSGSPLTPRDEGKIIRYLNTYYGSAAKTGSEMRKQGSPLL